MDISSGFGRLFHCMFPNQTTIAYSYRYTQHYTLKKRSIQVAVWSNEPGWQASATIREVLCNKVVGERQADLPCSDELERVACVFYCRPSSKYTECPFRRSYASWYARRSWSICLLWSLNSNEWIPSYCDADPEEMFTELNAHQKFLRTWKGSRYRRKAISY